MVVNRLTIHVNQAWIARFNEANMKLCFATAVESGGSSRYNVVAYADCQSDPALVLVLP